MFQPYSFQRSAGLYDYKPEVDSTDAPLSKKKRQLSMRNPGQAQGRRLNRWSHVPQSRESAQSNTIGSFSSMTGGYNNIYR